MDGDPFSDINGNMHLFIIGFFVIAGLVLLTILVTLAIFGTVAFRSLSLWNRNNNAPALTVPAVLVAKRQDVTRRENYSSSAYFATFEIQGHDRVELPVPDHEWGTLLEGDRGRLTYQGNRFRGFDRQPQDR